MSSRAPTFLVTKEYRRFAEFCEACRRERYVGLCYGPPGIGKTLSARHYAHWDDVEPLLSSLRMAMRTPIPSAVGDGHALVYTPDVAATPTRLASDLRGLVFGFNRLVEDARGPDDDRPCWPDATAVDLLLVDEADRLKMAGLEQVRDFYDRANFGVGLGLVLIGLPGLEKRLARYPQLYSRVGFVHRYRPLGEEELRFVLTHKWAELGLAFAPDDYTDSEAMAAIARITGGNFRLVQRLFSQIERILRINALQTITQEVVEAAREQLVIGHLP
ncbi:MAG: AAA family ATPase [Chloroflexota bacterium]|nr:AAA family ATPase [Chloroflexota bacterium]